MARARNIKPGFFRNADLAELSFECRLLFIGLWTLADREGRLEDRPKQIKMEIFPADNLDCDEALDMLAATGMLTRYEHGGKRYLQVVNFLKHQNPHRDERVSTIPAQGSDVVEESNALCEEDVGTIEAQCEHGANTVGIGLNPESRSLNPDSLIPEPLIPTSASKAGAACVVMKSEGMGQVSPSHPLLIDLLAKGAEVGDFADAARIAVEGKKGFSYALAIVKSRLEKTQELAGQTIAKNRAPSGGIIPGAI